MCKRVSTTQYMTYCTGNCDFPVSKFRVIDLRLLLHFLRLVRYGAKNPSDPEGHVCSLRDNHFHKYERTTHLVRRVVYSNGHMITPFP